MLVVQSVGGLVVCRGYPNGVGYVGFVAGGCDLAMRRGGLVGAKKKQKLSHRGLVLARKH